MLSLEEGPAAMRISSRPAASARVSGTAGAGEPSRRRPLTRDQVFAAALAIVHQEGVGPLECILELLVRAGFVPADALSTYRALLGFVHGHLLNELQEIIDNPEETDDLLRLGLYRLPIREFPRLRSLASALAAYDGAVELEHGLDILLDGISARYAPLPGAPAGGRGGPSPTEPAALPVPSR